MSEASRATSSAAELALPLVVRIERASPPARTDALEAAARAVLVMLTTDVEQWRPAVRQWDGRRIRKVVRRARGAAWQRAVSDVDGVTITHRSAQVRVYPPVPVDDWPPELAKLQVGGTELDDPTDPEPPGADVPLILLSPHAEMTAGKAMAQVGHAAQLGWRACSPRARRTWQARDFSVGVRLASATGWERALELGVPVVHDGGFTEVAPNTRTAAILLPW
jgi:peptidyl-tRNA hydrolase